jgi:hypothetical protein
MAFDDPDPLEGGSPLSGPQFGDPPVPAGGQLKATTDQVAKNQEPFLKLAGQFHDLFWKHPTLPAREIDTRLLDMWESFMDSCSVVGLSRFGIPQLKECCGKKRDWPLEKSATDLAPVVDEPRYLRIGDAIRWVTKNILRIRKPCEACEQRRQFLNHLIKLGTKRENQG